MDLDSHPDDAEGWPNRSRVHAHQVGTHGPELRYFGTAGGAFGFDRDDDAGIRLHLSNAGLIFRRRGLMIRRIKFVTLLAVFLFPGPASAFCGLDIDADTGRGILAVWGAAILGLGGFTLHRMWQNATVHPKTLALRNRLGEHERGLALVTAQLLNAENYPKECSLTEDQRRDRQEAANALRINIADVNAQLAST